MNIMSLYQIPPRSIFRTHDPMTTIKNSYKKPPPKKVLTSDRLKNPMVVGDAQLLRHNNRSNNCRG